jgi:hypothetical protein
MVYAVTGMYMVRKKKKYIYMVIGIYMVQDNVYATGQNISADWNVYGRQNIYDMGECVPYGRKLRV